MEKSITVLENQLQYLENHWSAAMTLQMIQVVGTIAIVLICIAGAVITIGKLSRRSGGNTTVSRDEGQKIEDYDNKIATMAVTFVLLGVASFIFMLIDYHNYVSMMGCGKFYFIIKLLR